MSAEAGAPSSSKLNSRNLLSAALIHEIEEGVPPIDAPKVVVIEPTPELETNVGIMTGAIPMMAELSSSTLLELATAASTRVYRDGEDIIADGQVGNALFFIIIGSAQEEKNGNVLSVMGPGCFFGEANLLSKAHRDRVFAVGVTECLSLGRAEVDQLSEAAGMALRRVLKRLIAAKFDLKQRQHGDRLTVINAALQMESERPNSPSSTDADEDLVRQTMLEALQFGDTTIPVGEDGEAPRVGSPQFGEAVAATQSTASLGESVGPEGVAAGEDNVGADADEAELDSNVEMELRFMFLDSVPLFSAMTRDELLRLAELMASEYYEDEPVVEKGEDGDSMFILKDGRCEAIKELLHSGDGDGGVKVLCTYTPGDFFGELALLSAGGRRAATVRAVGSAECLRLGREPFQQVVMQNPRVRELCVRHGRNHAAIKIQAYFRSFSARQRIIRRSFLGDMDDDFDDYHSAAGRKRMRSTSRWAQKKAAPSPMASVSPDAQGAAVAASALGGDGPVSATVAAAELAGPTSPRPMGSGRRGSVFCSTSSTEMAAAAAAAAAAAVARNHDDDGATDAILTGSGGVRARSHGSSASSRAVERGVAPIIESGGALESDAATTPAVDDSASSAGGRNFSGCSEVVRFLAGVPLLEAMSVPELSQVAGVMTSEYYEDEPIIEQGDTSDDSMYVLQKGTAVATLASRWGKARVVRRYAPGDFFGEGALLSNNGSGSRKRAATVSAEGPVELLRLGSAPFKELVGHRKQVQLMMQQEIRNRPKPEADEEGEQ